MGYARKVPTMYRKPLVMYMEHPFAWVRNLW